MMITEKIKNNLVLCLILLAGLAVRLYNLTNTPLWYDETVSVANAQKPFAYFFGIPHTFSYKTLYFVFLKLWIALFGPWDCPLRMLSVFFGIVSVYLIYRLAALIYNKHVGLWSAFLLSISTFHIYHSRQVRHYTLMVLLVILSFYFFVKFFQKQKRVDSFFNTAVNFLVLNTHPYGSLVILTQFFLALLAPIKAGKLKSVLEWTFWQAAVVFFYVVFSVYPALFFLQEKTWWIPKLTFFVFPEMFLTLISGIPRYGLDDYPIPLSFLIPPLIFSIPIFYLLVRGIGEELSSRDKVSPSGTKTFSGKVMLCWFLVPLISAFLISQFKSLFVIKHLIYILPAFLILIARGIEALRAAVFKVALVVLFVLNSIYSISILYNYDFNVNWKQPAQYINSKLKAGDAIVVSTAKEMVPFFYYFDYLDKNKLKTLDIYGEWMRAKARWREVFEYKGVSIIGVEQHILGTPWGFHDFDKKYLRNKFNWKGKNMWLAVSRWGEGGYPDIERRLSESHRMVKELKFNGVTLYYWEKL